MIELLAKACFVGVVALAGLPAVAFLERRRAAALAGEPRSARDAGVDLLASGLKALGPPGPLPRRARTLVARGLPGLAVLAPLAVLALVPFGGVYGSGDGTLRLVASDAPASLVLALGLLALGGLVPLLTGWASQEPAVLRTGLVEAEGAIALQLPLLLAALGVVMVFGRLELLEIAVAQDRTLALPSLLGSGFGSAGAALAGAGVPGWGIVLQPLGFLVFFFAAVASGRGLAATGASPPGFDTTLLKAGDALRLLGFAGLATTLFLGGASIPGLPAEVLVPAVASLLGTGFATSLCIVLQAGVFAAKLGFVVWLQVAVRDLPFTIARERRARLCWRVLLPLAIANLVATAGVLAVGAA